MVEEQEGRFLLGKELFGVSGADVLPRIRVDRVAE